MINFSISVSSVGHTFWQEEKKIGKKVLGISKVHGIARYPESRLWVKELVRPKNLLRASNCHYNAYSTRISLQAVTCIKLFVQLQKTNYMTTTMIHEEFGKFKWQDGGFYFLSMGTKVRGINGNECDWEIFGAGFLTDVTPCPNVQYF